MAKNIESGINSFTEVLNKVKSLGIKEWVEVSLENGSSIRLTEDHEVLTSNRGWVEAGKLTADDDIVSLK
jgi:intein/homing endonuclease